MEKQRLDRILVNKNLASSGEKAKALIMSGVVKVNGTVEDKAGAYFLEDAEIEIVENTLPYVSRGGLKIEKAIKEFDIDLTDKICADIGASTGGFTDCMLQNGASKVYAIDVGFGQLDWSLRQNENVVVMEKCNARFLTKQDVNDKIDFVSQDVSFISAKKMISAVNNILDDNGELVILIKPQFEAQREEIKKHGVVRDIKVHKRVIKEVIDEYINNGYSILGLTYSPIKGPKGNIEYLSYFTKADKDSINYINMIDNLCEEAFTTL